eukprot:207026-Alexandrium_andersonii.AAC.1
MQNRPRKRQIVLQLVRGLEQVTCCSNGSKVDFALRACRCVVVLHEAAAQGPRYRSERRSNIERRTLETGSGGGHWGVRWTPREGSPSLGYGDRQHAWAWKACKCGGAFLKAHLDQPGCWQKRNTETQTARELARFTRLACVLVEVCMGMTLQHPRPGEPAR